MPTATVPERHFVGHGDIIVEANLVPEQFYANAFVLGDLQPQQMEILRTLPIDESPEQTHPRNIGQVVEGAGSDQERSRLGKNLLDSFALIFAQPGPEGVVATAMEISDTEPHMYTIYLSKNYIEYGSISSLAGHIEELFNTGDKNNLQNNVWKAILLNCYPSICKSINETFEIFKSYSKPEILDYIQDTRTSINTWVSGATYLLSILDKLHWYILDIYRKGLDPKRQNEKHGVIELHSTSAGSELTDFLDEVAQPCFQLLEFHGDSLPVWLKMCLKVPLEKLQQKQEQNWLPEPGRWTWKLRRLIYTIASYRRAWYDIIRFKRHHNSATLRFVTVHREDLTTSMAVRCIADAGIRMKILKEGSKDKFIEKYRSNLAKDNAARSNHCPGCMAAPGSDSSLKSYLENEEDWACLWVHCEMQILELLLTRDHSKFFNYIGCSKGPCWLCYHTVKNMTSKFEMREPHLKLYPGWKPPAFKDSPPHREQCIKVLRFLDLELRKLARRAYQKNDPKDSSLASLI
ncbi:hypothetical protein F4820DRAFT_61277 [Hypoxylon rubiginosum]|uniref:Uncharacterized protein n=1 Tax=Hypoxylon rubiginosum TaxID=110542 RepID=A0ACB9ZBD1_9PEZI|nr:hypothetical protein F4820DRAFT_61277 [Hypoxylon rubiginosum]